MVGSIEFRPLVGPSNPFARFHGSLVVVAACSSSALFNSLSSFHPHFILDPYSSSRISAPVISFSRCPAHQICTMTRPRPTTRKPSLSSISAVPARSRSSRWATSCAHAVRIPLWRRSQIWRSPSVETVRIPGFEMADTDLTCFAQLTSSRS